MYARYNPYGGRSLARKGEGWHKRGWRDHDGSMAVNVVESPKFDGQHTCEIKPSDSGDTILRHACCIQGDGVPRDIDSVVFHQKREIYGSKTAADFGIDSGQTLYLKHFDKHGNLLKRIGVKEFQYNSPYVIDDDAFSQLDEWFQEEAWPDTDWMKRAAKEVRVTPTNVADWFSWRRATTGTGHEEPGDRGLVAVAREAQARAQRQAAQATANAAHAAARAAAAEAALDNHQSRRLMVEGEAVEFRSASHHGAGWFALLPSRVTIQAIEDVEETGSTVLQNHHGLLDTGNAARTMVNANVAMLAGIVAGHEHVNIRGVNGLASYPIARVRFRIRGVEIEVAAALGGDQGVLVGMDVIGPLFERGFSIAGYHHLRARSMVGGLVHDGWTMVAEAAAATAPQAAPQPRAVPSPAPQAAQVPRAAPVLQAPAPWRVLSSTYQSAPAPAAATAPRAVSAPRAAVPAPQPLVIEIDD